MTSTTAAPSVQGRRPAGHAAMVEVLERQACATSTDAAPPAHPLAQRLTRALARTTGADPLHPSARTPYAAALGARLVARQLERLPSGLHLGAGRRRWHVLHSVPAQLQGQLQGQGAGPGAEGEPLVADHVVVGPGGVVVLTALHLPGRRVRATRSGVVVEGQRLPVLRETRRTAAALQQLLGVPVSAAVVVVAAERLTLGRPGSVAVLPLPRLVRWLQRRPEVLDEAATDAAAAAVRALDALSPHPGQQPSHGPSQRPEDRFAALSAAVRRADRLRRTWFATAAVASCTGVVVVLLDVLS